ncbi:hypothetical protein DSO57_1024980 [Entomophthora muscae]|uniref:Uncharacterized protein n=2 Tax=Entomophthora muscae TaxID=34485 RepID=A0ACC2SFB1_9FUNG|nr:hypothetical protein DSO57_1024980 [Entomophthora muscae]
MIFSTLAYVDQARSLLFARSSKGFSATSCILLLIANVLRVFLGVYEGKSKSELVELGTDSLMLLPVILLSIFFSIRGGATPTSGVEALSTVTSVLIITFFFFGEVVGFFEVKSLFGTIRDAFSIFSTNGVYFPETISVLETLAPIAQVFASLRAGSGSTLSSLLVLLRLFVDVKRIYFYALNTTPRQLVISGQIQLLCSVILFLQAYLSGNFLRLALRIPVLVARIVSFIAGFIKPKAKAAKRTPAPRKAEEVQRGIFSKLLNPFDKRPAVEAPDTANERDEELAPVQERRSSFIGVLGGRLLRVLGGNYTRNLKKGDPLGFGSCLYPCPNHSHSEPFIPRAY